MKGKETASMDGVFVSLQEAGRRKQQCLPTRSAASPFQFQIRICYLTVDKYPNCFCGLREKKTYNAVMQSNSGL